MARHLASTIPLLALLCVALTLAVAARRGFMVPAIGRIPPGISVTSGFEAESFFALWRAVHDEPVFQDPFRLPYAATYFNWLFYSGYAAPLRLMAAGHADAHIPLAGRFVTAIGACVGAGALFLLLSRLVGGGFSLPAAWAAFGFGGPLVGWWIFTVRPDVWALTFEVLGIAALLLGFRSRPAVAAIAAACFLFCAWSCKQTHVLAAATALAFLFYRRRWIELGWLAGCLAVLIAATIVVLGPAYRASLIQAVGSSSFSLPVGAANFQDMLLKTFPLWAVASLGLGRTDLPVRAPVTDVRTFARLGLLLALPATFAASCKVGAASNYFLTAQLMLVLAAAVGAAGRPRALRLPAGLAGLAVLQLVVLVGWRGNIDLRPQAADLAGIWRAWEKQPEPRFSHLVAFNLPWLNPNSPPLVLAFDYPANRRAGRGFEHDGVGGLISRGEFRSLLLPIDTSTEYDGAALAQYERAQEIGRFAIYRRLDTPSP